MYEIINLLHSYNRWLVFIALLGAIFMAWKGAISSSSAPLQRRLNLVTLILTDIQLTLGLVLYFFLSPITISGISNFGAAMKNSELRFFTVEHIFSGIIFVVLVHVAKVVFQKNDESRKSFRKTAIYYTLAFLFLLLTIPWPFRQIGRPFFP